MFGAANHLTYATQTHNIAIDIFVFNFSIYFINLHNVYIYIYLFMYLRKYIFQYVLTQQYIYDIKNRYTCKILNK
jgi:hypothetical protein